MTKHSDPRVPIRTCVGCRRRRPQHELHRCVLGADGVARVDRHAPGRGAWLCGPECAEVARKRRAFDRAWRRTVAPAATESLADLLTGRSNPTTTGGERPHPCETDDDDERLRRERGEEHSGT